MTAVFESLREYADAVDKDRGFVTGLTDTMRDAADELERLTTRNGVALSFVPAAKVEAFHERCRQLDV